MQILWKMELLLIVKDNTGINQKGREIYNYNMDIDGHYCNSTLYDLNYYFYWQFACQCDDSVGIYNCSEFIDIKTKHFGVCQLRKDQSVFAKYKQ